MPPTLELLVDGSAETLSRMLQHGEPPLHLGEGRLDANLLILNPLTVREDDDATLVRCLLTACAALPPASPASAAAAQTPSPSPSSPPDP